MAEDYGFFSDEAGQARRAALNDFLNENLDYYLGPTGIPDRLRAVNEFLNPVVAMEGASVSADRAFDSSLPVEDRLLAAGDAALNTALFGVPGALAYRGFMPRADAVAETLAGITALSPEARDVVRTAVERLNQPGPMPTLYSNPVPGMGDNGAPSLDPDPVPARLQSRLMRSLDQVGQPRGTYGQLRQRLINLGGGAPAERELAFTGMDRMFNPDDSVSIEELRSYLEGTTDMFESPTNVATGATGPSSFADEGLETTSFDPGATQFSEYMTPGLKDYFETEYRFTDPGGIYPLGVRNVPGMATHDFGHSDPGFMHVRGAQSVDGMGGDGNTWLMGEIQSDVGQSLRSQRGSRVPTRPDIEAALVLSDSGTGRDLPEDVWERIQDPSFNVLGAAFFNRRLVLNPDFTPPSAESFTRAVSSAQTQSRDYLLRGAAQVRQMREELAAEAQEALDILRDGVEADGTYLGYDSAGMAMSNINQTINAAKAAGQDPLENVQSVWDIDPTRSERDRILSEAVRRYIGHSYLSEDRATRVDQMRDLEERVRRYGSFSGDRSEIGYLRQLTDVDVPLELERRIGEGKPISPDDLDRVYAEQGPVVAASLAARNELGLGNINPDVLRDISAYRSVYESSTYTPMPFTESTNQWVDYGLRNQLLEAANAGREYFAITNPEMVRRMTHGTEEGQSQFYGNIVPQRLRNIIRGLDKNAPTTSSAYEFKKNPEVVFGPGLIQTDYGPEAVTMVRLTPELRSRILGEGKHSGLTTFMRPEAAVAGSGLASLALMGEEDEIDNY